MEQTPKYYRFSRVTIGNMIAASKLFGRLATTSIGGSTLTGISQLSEGTKINLIVPIVMGIIAFCSAIINEELTWIVSVSEMDEPAPGHAS